MRLAEDRCYNEYPCIILTAKGQPDVATRLFLRRLKEQLGLPVLALVDSDPYGLKILSAHSCVVLCTRVILSVLGQQTMTRLSPFFFVRCQVSSTACDDAAARQVVSCTSGSGCMAMHCTPSCQCARTLLQVCI
jgi:hypothetical protein